MALDEQVMRDSLMGGYGRLPVLENGGIYCKSLIIFFTAVSSTYLNKGSLTYIPSAKKSRGGGHHSHYVFCVEGCLRLQKNIGLRPLNRRNTTS